MHRLHRKGRVYILKSQLYVIESNRVEQSRSKLFHICNSNELYIPCYQISFFFFVQIVEVGKPVLLTLYGPGMRQTDVERCIRARDGRIGGIHACR